VTQEQTPSDGAPDSSDIIEGPIGSARLKEPADPQTTGADLSALPEIDDAPADDADAGKPA
jgi:hypothetical protein